MRAPFTAFMALLLVAGSFCLAKSKSRDPLPAYILRARTVSVVIDPEAGMSLEDPNANQIARRDVEAALLQWGRFEPQLAGQPADLIVVIRRGHHRLVTETVPDPRQNDRIGGINPTDNTTSIGGRQGPPDLGSPGPPGSRLPDPMSRPQTEIGNEDDSFAVYDGTAAKPLNAPAAWRYVAVDALRPHAVPAVAEFRKAVAAAEKAAANHP